MTGFSRLVTGKFHVQSLWVPRGILGGGIYPSIDGIIIPSFAAVLLPVKIPGLFLLSQTNYIFRSPLGNYYNNNNDAYNMKSMGKDHGSSYNGGYGINNAGSYGGKNSYKGHNNNNNYGAGKGHNNNYNGGKGNSAGNNVFDFEDPTITSTHVEGRKFVDDDFDLDHIIRDNVQTIMLRNLPTNTLRNTRDFLYVLKDKLMFNTSSTQRDWT